MMKLCDISIREFMRCMFEYNYGFIGGVENWDPLYTSYIDLSGIGRTKEYEIIANIHNTHERLIAVTALLELNLKFFIEFSLPFVNSFEDFKKYGHRLVWDENNPQKFVKQLEGIEIKEKTYKSRLDQYIYELKQLQTEGVKLDGNGRKEFVLMMNKIMKDGYKIDKQTTDMESYSLMIFEYTENIKQDAS